LATPRKKVKSSAPRSKVRSRKAKAPAGRVRQKKREKAEPPTVIPIEVEPGKVELALAQLREELQHWVKKGRYTKVRFKLRGKALLPDIPVAAVIAAEAATFWWTGLLKALLLTVGAGALLDVELVNGAEQEVARGKEALLTGDLDEALKLFEKAAEMDRDSAMAHLNLGIGLKLKGERERALSSLTRALELDPEGPHGQEAKRLLEQMKPPPPIQPS